MKASDYISLFRDRHGFDPPDNVVSFYARIAQYDDLKDRLDAIASEVEALRERQAIQREERERLRGVRIFGVKR